MRVSFLQFIHNFFIRRILCSHGFFFCSALLQKFFILCFKMRVSFFQLIHSQNLVLSWLLFLLCSPSKVFYSLLQDESFFLSTYSFAESCALMASFSALLSFKSFLFSASR